MLLPEPKTLEGSCFVITNTCGSDLCLLSLKVPETAQLSPLVPRYIEIREGDSFKRDM